MKIIDYKEKCDNCKHYYFDGRYSDDYCMIDCPDIPDKDCQLCIGCQFFKECLRDYENEVK